MSNNFERFKQRLNDLDPDYYYNLYFDYYLLQNIRHSPLLIFTKALCWITGKQPIDHICGISRFPKDEEGFKPKIFEASTKKGMVENDLIERISKFKGKLYIEKVAKVDKKLAKELEDLYKGVEYDYFDAAVSGIDTPILGRILKPRKKGLFCSLLRAIFLKSFENGKAFNYLAIYVKGEDLYRNVPVYEYTPVDIWDLKLGTKELIFDSNSK